MINWEAVIEDWLTMDVVHIGGDMICFGTGYAFLWYVGNANILTLLIVSFLYGIGNVLCSLPTRAFITARLSKSYWEKYRK